MAISEKLSGEGGGIIIEKLGLFGVIIKKTRNFAIMITKKLGGLGI